VDAVLGTQVYLRRLWDRMSGEWSCTLESLRALAVGSLQSGWPHLPTQEMYPPERLAADLQVDMEYL
jgi:hypothetical protein